MANDALIRNLKKKKEKQEFFYYDTQVRTLLIFFFLFQFVKHAFEVPPITVGSSMRTRYSRIFC